jgi:hypothetical protein
MKITLKELRSIVRESVRSHLKETERRDLSNQEGPFIGSDVSREASTNEPEYIFKVLSIFQKYASTAPGDRDPAIHHYATIDSYPNGVAKQASEAKRDLASRNLSRRERASEERRFSQDIGNLKELAIGELAEELGLVPEEVLKLRAARTALGLSGGLTLNKLASIAKEADEELSSNRHVY